MSAQIAISRAEQGEAVDGLAFRAETLRILSWWASHAVDEQMGGFWGEVDCEGHPVAGADKGGVLNARLLWFFSAVAHRCHRVDAAILARRAFDYFRSHFVDRAHGGVYWSVDASGRVKNARKQAYGQAFAIYGLTEFHVATGDMEALGLARELLSQIETRFWDPDGGGYIEALSEDWGGLSDQRLSERDLDCPKTMNTHLHILEAYSRLYQAAPDSACEKALRRTTQVLLTRFIEGDGRQLRLFFDMDWTDRTHSVSFGHDIEASWLIWEAVQALDDATLQARARPVVLGLAAATLSKGVLPSGGLAYEQELVGARDEDGEWWGQAEGLIGFVNAWEISGDEAYLSAAGRLWAHIARKHAGDPDGEWTWYAADSPRPRQALAGPWKCPYHNGRAMLELDRRLGSRGQPWQI